MSHYEIQTLYTVAARPTLEEERPADMMNMVPPPGKQMQLTPMLNLAYEQS
jgi:hypothetical protein